MDFEFDPAKSRANKRKHGIDFIEAQTIWQDARHVILPARDRSEPRRMVIGLADNKLWSAIVTFREDKIRLISVRRARLREVDCYENQIEENDRFNA